MKTKASAMLSKNSLALKIGKVLKTITFDSASVRKSADVFENARHVLRSSRKFTKIWASNSKQTLMYWNPRREKGQQFF